MFGVEFRAVGACHALKTARLRAKGSHTHAADRRQSSNRSSPGYDL